MQGASAATLTDARAIGSGASGSSQKDAAHVHGGLGMAAMLRSIDNGATPIGKVARAARPSRNRADRWEKDAGGWPDLDQTAFLATGAKIR